MFSLSTLLLLTAAPQVAIASTTEDVQLAQDPVGRDGDLLFRRADQPDTGLWWPRSAWHAWVGDLDGDLLLDVPAGIDALAILPRRGSARFTVCDLVFSTDANFLSFLDGDLLRLDTRGGIEVLMPEDELVQALGITSGRLDVDALHLVGETLVQFSSKDNLQTTALGAVDDGDVLLYDRTLGTVTRTYTEAQLQALVDHADPGAGSLGDVRALSVHPTTDELVFSVQSPTAADATLYGDGAGGRILPGWTESDWGFRQGGELDALAFALGDMVQPPIMEVDVPYALAGSTVKLKLRHGTPHGIVKGVMTRKRAFAESAWGGMRAIFLDQTDPLWVRQHGKGWMHPTVCDASGSADYDWPAPTIPPQYAFVPHYFQAFDLESGSLSNPVVVRVD